MDRRLLQYYERELRFVRELGAEFARRFPKVAGRLGITELACDDPHVERLFQGFAFLAAGVGQRLDAEFPQFTSNLMEAVYPQHLGPTPSMAVVEFEPSAQAGSLTSGYTVPRGTVLRTRNNTRGVPGCEYRTGHSVELWPIAIEEVEYTSVLKDIADLHIPSQRPVRGLLRVRLRTSHGRPFNQLSLQKLALHLRGNDERSARLYEALIAQSASLVMRWGHNPSLHTARSSAGQPVQPLGFQDEQALLPCGPAAFRGYRLLQEYFAFPSRFQFVELTGLETGVARCDRDRLDLLIPLMQHDDSLQGAVDKDRLLLYTTPVVNLFPLACDRIALADGVRDLHVVPNRARPLDFEVHSITRVAFTLQGTSQEVELLPQRSMRGRFEREGGERLHYALDRRPRLVGLDEPRVGQRAGYAGSEVYLKVVEGLSAAFGGSRQLSVNALCTNRDLPLRLLLGRGGNDFSLESGAPVEVARCVAGPSAPRSSPVEGATAWHMISELTQNYLGVCQEAGGAAALRELLHLYAQLGDPQLRRQPEGVRSVSATPVIRPMPAPGPRSFVRGLEIRVDCEEQAFAAHGVFTLASVLSEFFAKHASIHSFTELVLSTRERGEIHRWPAVAGLRHTL